ncbi:hypothetical protein D3228_10500 [Leucobacter luti]|nr:hypothetical protein [Leucobacter luti]
MVIGDGIPELAAALELAEVGLRVLVTPFAAPEPHPAPADVAPHPDSCDTAGLRDPDGTLREFVTYVATPVAAPGAAAAPADPALSPALTPPAPVLVRGAKGEWVPQPQPAVWGIPAVPLATDTMAALGGGAAMRAWLDRIRPVLTIGKTHEFGALVRSRMGRAVLTTLVDPLAREAYGVAPEQIDAAIIAPGLNEALTRLGTLSGAVLDYAEREVARETTVRPATGWGALRAALVARLRLYAVVFAEVPAARFTRAEELWEIEFPDGVRPESGRAVIHGSRAEAPGIPTAPAATGLDALLGGQRRLLGEIAIADPELPASHAAWPAVQAVALADGTRCAVRFERTARATGPEWVARVAGAAGVGPDPEPAAAAAIVTEAVRAAGGTPTESIPRVSMPFAPYATVRERDAAVAALEALCQAHPGQVPTGVGLHGGDLATAVADARLRAVQLRRHLTGIAD